MAVYVSVGRRRRNTVLLACLTAILGLASGWAIGHAQAPNLASQTASVQRTAGDLASRVGALPIEYAQAITGNGDTLQGGVLDALAGIKRDTLHELDRAPWIGQHQRDALIDRLSALAAAAKAMVTKVEFATACTDAAGLITTTYG